jgi:hypothetical protein
MEQKKSLLTLSEKDLRKHINLYDSEQIIHSILNDNISLVTLARTQKLTPYICAKYIIFGGNYGEYGTGDNDRILDDNDILRLQRHITKQELAEAHIFVSKEEREELIRLNAKQ